jgi:hypothetical protein
MRLFIFICTAETTSFRLRPGFYTQLINFEHLVNLTKLSTMEIESMK